MTVSAAITAALLSGLGSAPAGALQDIDTAAIIGYVERQMTTSRIPGAALVIVHGDQLFVRTFSRGGAPLSTDAPFPLGSVTKTFTALAIAQLVDAGALGFDDLVQEHLPGFSLAGASRGHDITLRHLLTHRSGLRQWSGHDRRAQHDGRFDHITPARPPGARFEYSSLNYIILGRIIETASGLSYEAYVQRHIFAPLEMTASFANLETARRNGLVTGHRYLFGLALPGREKAQPEPLVPAGFLMASARDLGNYIGMLLNDGQFRGRQIVRAETLREMFTPWQGARPGPGMAWGIGETTIGHAGNTPTFSARIALLPAERAGIALLSTINSGPLFPGTATLMAGITDLLRGRPVRSTRPDEILFKLALLGLLLAGAARALLRGRRWRRRGSPRRLHASRRVLTPLFLEAAAATFVLLLLPRWIGVPFPTLLAYFPDLGIAMLAGVLTGLASALFRSLVLAQREAAAPAS